MKALVKKAKGVGNVELDFNYPKPQVKPGWVLVEVYGCGICGTDLHILEDFKKATGYSGRITQKTNKRSLAKSGESTISTLRITSQRFTKHAIEAGIKPRKSGNTTLPASALIYPGSFCRGFFDGDGSISYRNFTFICNSESFTNELKDLITKSKYDIKLVEEKINLQVQNIEEHKKNNDAEIDKKKAEIKSSKEQLTQLNKDIELINKHIVALQNKVGDKKEKLDKKSKSLFQIKGKVQTNIDRNQKEIDFYENNHDCPTCKQPITSEWKDSQVKEKTEKINTQRAGIQEIESELQNVTDELNSITTIISHINAHNGEVIKNTSTITAINDYIGKLNREITELTNRSVNTEGSDLKLNELKTQLEEFSKSYEEQLIEKNYYEFAGTLLKDGGIKSRIIKQYLPIMNKLINKYLTAMDFFVNFNINENFEETIKSRHRDEFSYANFSEGEKMRIDLALLFTWRQIAKLKNSTNTNLLILDEVFDSSLDTVGTEEFLKLINEMGTDTNVFVISHKGDQLFDKFRSVIKFDKKNNFSRIV